MSRSILDLLGLDADEFDWQNLATCAKMDTELFYDRYESSDSIARMVDQICLSCPVMKECLQRGIDGGETGVWGGFYLKNGKVDEDRNSHKTEETKAQIRERISG